MELVYIENHLGVATINSGQHNERHGLVFTEANSQQLDEWAYNKLLVWTDNRRKSRRLTDCLLRHVKTTKWMKPQAEAARNDLLDRDFAASCIRAAMPHLTGGYMPAADARYEVRLEPGPCIEEHGIRFDMSIGTDFDFVEANRSYQRFVPDATFGTATVMSGVFGGLADLRTAALFSDEMAVSPAGLAIAEVKLAQLLSKRRNSSAQVAAFQEWTCEDGKAIGEAVRAKHKNFDDVLRLVEEAGRFKQWLAEHEDSADLRREYLKAVCASSWAEKLPPKTIRLLLFNAAGTALGLITTAAEAAAASLGLSILDSFLVDRLVKAWKPNQFVEGPLKEFIK